jgi:hypothetical protein
MKLNKQTAVRIEEILKQAGWRIIYDKGNFQSGYCKLDDQKIIVVNKFFTFESRLATLIDVVISLELSAVVLEEEQLAFIQKLRQARTQADARVMEAPNV